MTSLTDEIAAAEQRARELVVAAFESEPVRLAPLLTLRTEALDRLAAVCRLAGRWEQHQADFVGDAVDAVQIEIERDLARLMEGL